MRIIEIAIRNEYVSGDGVAVGAAGSHHDVALRISFNAMWSGLAKSILFKNAIGENAVTVPLLPSMVDGDETYLVSIPAEAKEYEGDIVMIVRGAKTAEEIETQATLTTTASFKVLESEWEYIPEQDITPTQAELFTSELENMRDDILRASAAADAKEAAEAAASAAEGYAASAEEYKDAASGYEEAAMSHANLAEGYARSAGESATEASGYAEDAENHETGAAYWAEGAAAYANEAGEHLSSVERLATNAYNYSVQAGNSAANAAISERSANDSSASAVSSAAAARESEIGAMQAAENAKSFSASAKEDAIDAAERLADATLAASRAESHANTASIYSNIAQTAADEAKRYKIELDGISARAETLPAGSDASAEYDEGVITIGVPRGEKGEKGDRGEKGDTGEVTEAELQTALAAKADASALDSTNKLLYNVTELLKGHEYSLQDGETPAYTQSVPAGVQKYALLAMLGGHSEVVNGEVIHGKCDKIVTENGEIAIPAQVQALDGYGWSAGALYNYADFSAQQFHKRIGRVELGALNWVRSTANPSRFYASVPSGNLWKYQAGNVMLCDVYTFDGEGNSIRGYYGADGTIRRYYRAGGSPAYELYVNDGGTYANIAEFKAHLAGKYLYFEAATEIVTDIVTDDIYIDTEQDGTVTFHQLDGASMLLPNKVTYMVRNEEAI